MRKPTEARTLKRSISFGSSPMMRCAVLKRQRTIGEMWGVAVPVTDEVKVKEVDLVL